MASGYPQTLDEGRLEAARKQMCDVFGIKELRQHQEMAGKNILRGITTVYDIPTGGGKTLAFWYPIFYHWTSDNGFSNSQKVVLILSPLNALMNSQANALNKKGIPVIAVNSEGGRIEDIFEVCNVPFILAFVDTQFQ